jgi:hypothetical protein
MSPGMCTVSYVSQKLCVFQPSSPLHSIHPLRKLGSPAESNSQSHTSAKPEVGSLKIGEKIAEKSFSKKFTNVLDQ